MVKVQKMLVLFVMLAALFSLSTLCKAQDVESDQESLESRMMAPTTENMTFNHTTLVGVVLDEKNNPVPNLRLELELAPDRDLRRSLAGAGATLENLMKGLKATVGSGVFSYATTNEKGEYVMKGITIPCVYHLFVRNAANYFPARIEIVIDSSTEIKEFKVQTMIVKTRDTAAKVISDKAIKEMDKARKAFKDKDMKNAIKSMESVLQMEPEYAEGYYMLAMIYLRNKNTDEALKNLEKAVQYDNQMATALNILGDIYLFKKDYEKTVKYYSQYMTLREKEGDLNLEDAKTYMKIGNSLKALKKNEEAIPYLAKYIELKQKVGKLDQKDALIANDLASYYYAKKDMDKAISLYTKAIETNPTINPETYMYLGNSYLTKRDAANALKYYQEYVKLDPKGKYVTMVNATIEKLKPVVAAEKK